MIFSIFSEFWTLKAHIKILPFWWKHIRDVGSFNPRVSEADKRWQTECRAKCWNVNQPQGCNTKGCKLKARGGNLRPDPGCIPRSVQRGGNSRSTTRMLTRGYKLKIGTRMHTRGCKLKTFKWGWTCKRE